MNETLCIHWISIEYG